jgi:hypothetical protein
MLATIVLLALSAPRPADAESAGGGLFVERPAGDETQGGCRHDRHRSDACGKRGGPPKRGGGHGGRHDRFRGPSVDDFARHLGLTDEQRARLDPLLKESLDRARARLDTLRHRKSFAGVDWPAFHGDMRRLSAEMRDRIRPHLTPEQVERLDRLHPAHPCHPVRPDNPVPAGCDPVARIVSLQAGLDAADRAVREAACAVLKAGKSENDDAARRLEAARRDRRALEDRLREARESLRRACTPRQEAELILRGILS